MAQQTVGMIGLGIMGSAMSANLMRAGFRVTGFDVVPRRRAEHKRTGGVAARSPSPFHQVRRFTTPLISTPMPTLSKRATASWCRCKAPGSPFTTAIRKNS